MRRLLRAAWAFALAPLPAAAAELGGCGDGRGVQSIIASSSTGAAVGSSLERGIVVYLHGLSKADNTVIDMPYGAGLLAEPNGSRFALVENRNVHVYTFSGFRRLSKTSVKVLKDQSILAWSWTDGTDDAVVLSQVVKSGAFGLGESRKTPYVLRFDVATGAGTQVPLAISNDYLSASFDAKGERVAIGFRDGHVEVRASADGKLLASYTGHGTPWNSLGLAFHPKENLLASAGGDKLILFDLDKKSIRATHRAEDGAKLLQYVADGQFLIGGSTFDLSLLDPQGRRLQTAHADEGYQDFYVADSLRKVFSVRENLVCWRTFERWEKVPVVSRGAGRADAPPAPTDVLYKGVPLSFTLEQLRGGDAKGKLDAAYAIEQIGPPAASVVADLLRALDSPEWTLRAGAARALGAIGPAAKAALPALEALGADKEEAVRAAAAAAVEKIRKERSR